MYFQTLKHPSLEGFWCFNVF